MSELVKASPQGILPQPSAIPLPINSVSEMQLLGQVLAHSQLFGTINPAEGLAIVAMCHQMGISWIKFMETYHLIKGKVSKKTDAAIADFHRMGGKHQIISRTPDLAEAKFTLGKESYISRLSWEDCKKEAFVYIGKEQDVSEALKNGKQDTLKLKAKYMTPRSRMQMLWARCVSDGVRTIASECFQGMYTPEETSDFAPDVAVPVAGQQVQPITLPAIPTVTESPVEAIPAIPATPAEENIEICTLGKCSGKKWSELPNDHLEFALNMPELSTATKDHISHILKTRSCPPPAVENPLAEDPENV